MVQSASMDVFQHLVTDMDVEGRYLLLNAITNHLRYPNTHTHYFSSVLLHLFADSKQESIRETITRVLLERMVPNKPHPWGVLATWSKLRPN